MLRNDSPCRKGKDTSTYMKDSGEVKKLYTNLVWPNKGLWGNVHNVVERQIWGLTVKEYTCFEKNVHPTGMEKPLTFYVIKVGFRSISDDGVDDTWEKREGNKEDRWEAEMLAWKDHVLICERIWGSEDGGGRNEFESSFKIRMVGVGLQIRWTKGKHLIIFYCFAWWIVHDNNFITNGKHRRAYLKYKIFILDVLYQNCLPDNYVDIPDSTKMFANFPFSFWCTLLIFKSTTIFDVLLSHAKKKIICKIYIKFSTLRNFPTSTAVATVELYLSFKMVTDKHCFRPWSQVENGALNLMCLRLVTTP